VLKFIEGSDHFIKALNPILVYIWVEWKR